VEEELLGRAQAAAKRKGWTLSGVIRNALTDLVKPKRRKRRS
jgi:hypothetical protein